MPLLKLFKRKKSKEPKADDHRAMADFFAEAEAEIEELIAADKGWYAKLPYPGAVSIEDARQMEIERLAIRNRVIYDAGRSKLAGLKWNCRNDSKSCALCRERHDRVIRAEGFAELAKLPHHLGCRCELMPVRD